MSCTCYQYPPCDQPCPSCHSTTTTSTTTTTTVCPDAEPCVEVKKDICVEYPGDNCSEIPAGTNLQQTLFYILQQIFPECTTTSTTSTTSTTTIPPTTTTTTCICPSTTTTTSTSTTTTTTLPPCECLTFSIRNITTSTQTYSYTDCSRVQFNNVSIAAGQTQLICVCDEDIEYDRTKFILLSVADGCNTSTTTSTSTSTTSTTSTSTTTTTTNPCPECISYSVQALSLPASWTGKACPDGRIVAGGFITVGETITTPCICQGSLVLVGAYTKEEVNCASTTTTSTSTTTTTTTIAPSTTTTSTTIAPTTTTTTVSCECYTLSNSGSALAYVEIVDCVHGSVILPIDGLSTTTVCVVTGSTITADDTIIVTACGTSCTSNINCFECTTTTTTGEPTTTTTTTAEPTTTTTTIEPTTTTTTTEESTTTTTTTISSCVGYVLDSGAGSASIEWFDCSGSPLTQTFTGQYTICTDGSGYTVTAGSVSIVSSGPC